MKLISRATQSICCPCLVGHATLAAAFVIFKRLSPDRQKVRFASRSGPLRVSRQGPLLAMDLPARVAVPCAAPAALVEGLGALSVETLAAQHYLAVFEHADQVRALAPRMDRLAALDRAAVIVTAPGGPGDFVSRFFAPANGVPEDPVSGVAHCTLIPYWSRRLGKTKLHARQVSHRGGDLFCEDRGDRVIISGPAVLVFEGDLILEAP
jgi:predicted PhzF superfamily epimerase YddE/YHI9